MPKCQTTYILWLKKDQQASPLQTKILPIVKDFKEAKNLWMNSGSAM